jgi:hypothetical protein
MRKEHYVLSDKEKEILVQIREVEKEQKINMDQVNSYLLSLKNIYEEGEEQHPELKRLNEIMISLIQERFRLFHLLGVIPESNLPEGVVHILSDML